MSTRFLKLLPPLVITLSLLPVVAAVPIPVSSPTATALIVYLSVVPGSLILLLIVKYFYVKHRRSDVAGGHTLSSESPSQLRTRQPPALSYRRSDWDRARIAFLVGLLGSPDWEIKRKESEHSTLKDTDSQFLCVFPLHYGPDPSGYISLGFFPPEIVRPLLRPAGTTCSTCSTGLVEPLDLQDCGFRPSHYLFLLQTSRSFTLWTAPLLPPKAP
jgi:hypothetical protein